MWRVDLKLAFGIVAKAGNRQRCKASCGCFDLCLSTLLVQNRQFRLHPHWHQDEQGGLITGGAHKTWRTLVCQSKLDSIATNLRRDIQQITGIEADLHFGAAIADFNLLDRTRRIGAASG